MGKSYYEEMSEALILPRLGNRFDYHNKDFSYRYLPSIEIDKAIKSIFKHRQVFENNNYWNEAKRFILELDELMREESGKKEKMNNTFSWLLKRD